MGNAADEPRDGATIILSVTRSLAIDVLLVSADPSLPCASRTSIVAPSFTPKELRALRLAAGWTPGA